jgi:hypothetical protein
VADTQKRAIYGNSIIQSSGKPVFWGEPIVGRINTKAPECEARRDRAVRLCGAAEVSAAVQIKENEIAGLRPFDPLAGNPA